MLSIPWKQRQSAYQFVVIGSGYGGSITAARIAKAIGQPHKLCILERGQEWQPGQFPSDVPGVLGAARSSVNPLGLYEFLTYRDISVIKGSGLGGTSLINANVAIVPDPEVFKLADWPRTLTFEELSGYYDTVRKVLDANPVPEAGSLLKVKALDLRSLEINNTKAQHLNLAVNFQYDGPNAQGVVQRPCTKCGDCVTGCNFSAKNTLYMNYLPMAAKAGADIFTQVKVEWIEKLSSGAWRIHGKRVESPTKSDSFTLDTANVILSAGSINSTEILLRSESRGLKVSPALGTGFSGNGDFFGLAYNGALQTDVVGYGQRTPDSGGPSAPGPSIVGVIRYNHDAPVAKRIAVEDFSFPSAYIQAAKIAFAAIRGDDTRIGDEAEQQQRLLADLDPARTYVKDGALNHTMLYLVMGLDDARGVMNFDAPWFERDGRMTIEWDKAGQQIVFTRMNEELRRHARALGANFISNPTWATFNTRHLITAHPLGGCPIGEDYQHGAVDEFGRVFSGDGSVHDGLYVADGALIPTALGVNPFLTISALSERIAARKIRDMQGDHYPKPATAVAGAGPDPLDVIQWSEAELERLFRRSTTLPLDKFINKGGSRLDLGARTIQNDDYWKGFFPQRHILNTLSSAIFTGFKKTFKKEGDQVTGLTTDTDGRITAHNTLEEIKVDRQTGTLEPGKYILLKYLDPEWSGFYDILKLVSEDLIIGRVYFGAYPNGLRMITFSMSRRYGFQRMTVRDHDSLWMAGTVPTKESLDGVWRMDMVSNNNHMASAAYLEFELKPDGRLASRYRLMGLFEGLVLPSFTQDHFQLNDFTPFHDEIRQVAPDYMVGKYLTGILPDLTGVLNGADLGILHGTPGSRDFGFYYTLSRADGAQLPTNPLLAPFLDVQLPDGVGLTFDEEMNGWFFEGATLNGSGRAVDLTLNDRIPASGQPAGGVPCGFQARIIARDINEFVDGIAHEAGIKGTVHLGDRTGTIDEQNSRFQYLVVNQASGEAEMRYHLVFRAGDDTYLLDGRKHMGRSGQGGVDAIRELLRNYTTLYCDVSKLAADGSTTHIGLAWLKFATFENFAALGNLAGFLGSFTVTGTNDPLMQLRARMRFIAFTAQFVQREYDPLSPDIGRLDLDVRAEVLRGADTPDYFSTRPTTDLQDILRDSPTLPIEKLINTGAVSFDLANGRVNRDLFWKGSFAKDTIVGWEERARAATVPEGSIAAGSIFTPGAFWKRFDKLENGVATGRVVNYDLSFLPGDPVARTVQYPDDHRRYLKKGDPVHLMQYRNDPYRPVYDLIKVIDENNAIGVMHLGEYPNGFVFATFVMSRYSYPLERMSVEDHRLLFQQQGIAPATQPQGDWQGHLILLDRPATSLITSPRTALFRASGADGRFRVGLESGGAVSWSDQIPGGATDLRALDADTLIGTWKAPTLPPALLASLRGYVEPYADAMVFYFLLKRSKAAAGQP